MYFPKEIWRQVKNYMLGQEYWKRKLDNCFYSDHNNFLTYKRNELNPYTISFYKPIKYCHRAERIHFNLVTEYWKGVSYNLDKGCYRIEPVTYWVNLN